MDNPLTLTNVQFTVFIVSVVIALLAAWVGSFYVIRKSPKQLEAVFRDGLLPKLLTIVLVVFATTILAMLGRLDEGPAAIFSGIVGYVLGTTNGPKGKSEDSSVEVE